MHMIHLGGVPEHYSVPAQLWASQQTLPDTCIQWHRCPGGTGEMVEKLCTGELDYALCLSEGAASARLAGKPLRLLQWYVWSPLAWGIHVKPGRFSNVEDLAQARFAISRPGSGSQLMAKVLAFQRDWANPEGFVTVGDIHGGIQALIEEQADVFLWERYTTAPWVESGQLERLGDCLTPWPPFVLCVSETEYQRSSQRAQQLASSLGIAATSFADRDDALSCLSQAVDLPVDRLKPWFATVKWSAQAVNRETLEPLLTTMKAVGLANPQHSIDALLGD